MTYEIITILIGVVGAIGGVYLKENYRIAKNQRAILIKLKTYLEYEHRRFFNNNKEVPLLKSINKIKNERKNTNQDINVDELILCANDKLKELKKEYEEKAKKNKNEFSDRFSSFFDSFSKAEGEYYFLSIESLLMMLDDINENRVLISDNEAAQLNIQLASFVIHYRCYLRSLIDSFISIKNYADNAKRYEPTESMGMVWKFLDDLICLLFLFDVLIEISKESSKKSTTKLMMENFLR